MDVTSTGEKKSMFVDFSINIKGTTPLIVHRFSKKAREQIAAKQAGKAREKKAPKDPEAETLACLYMLPGASPGQPIYGFPAAGFKKAAVAACRQVEGIPMTVARGAFHVYGDGVNEDGLDLVRIDGSWTGRCDTVRLDSGVTDLRYRPQSSSWEVDALDPQTLSRIISDAVEDVIDQDALERVLERERRQREKLFKLVKEARL